MKIQELIDQLAEYDPDEDVIATWEGITREIYVYQAKDGTVMIDADDATYSDYFVSGKWNPKKWINDGDDR